MREIILNLEEESMPKKTQINKLVSMLQYVDAYIFLTTFREIYNQDNSENKLELLKILQQASYNVIKKNRPPITYRAL